MVSRSEANHIKPIIGLSGGIGAGKSVVAAELRALGAGIIDSDRLAHAVLEEPEVVDSLRRWWGGAIVRPDGTVDRKAVGSIVFDAPDELKRLEELLYPRIERGREVLIERFNADPTVRAIVMDAPKLYEAGLEGDCDAVIFVDAARSLRLKRVAASRGWNEAELNRREKMQFPLDEKRANADHVVINQSDLDELRREVAGVFSSIVTPSHE